MAKPHEHIQNTGFRVEFDNPRSLFALLKANAPRVLRTVGEWSLEEWMEEDMPNAHLQLT